MNKKPSAKKHPQKPAAKRSAKAGESRLLAPEFLQERPGEQETLLALERLLTRSEGFTLAFARVNMPAQRAQLVREIRRRLEPRGFIFLEIDFREPVRDLLWELELHLKRFYGLKQKAEPRELAVAEAGPRMAIFVYGLENSISSSAIYHPLLAVMNYKRENFREQIPGPLVLWAPEYVLQAVIEGAPDFWAWRSGVFEFAAQQADVEKSLAAAPEYGYVELSRMSIEEKRNRIQLLASLLAEYESQENADRPEIAAIRADLLLRLGMLCFYLGELSMALEYLEKSLVIQREIGDRGGEGAVLTSISDIYRIYGDRDKALKYLEKILEICLEIGDRVGEGTTLNNLSQIYYTGGDYNKALESGKKSLAIQREIGDLTGEARTLSNLATTIYAGGDYVKALEYLERSLAIQREIGDRAGEGATLNNISQIYDARGDYDKALEYLERGLTIQGEIGDRAGESVTLNNIGGIYRAYGNYGKALEYLGKSLGIQREIGDRAGECATRHNMAHIYLQHKKIDEAIKAFFEALQVAQQINYAELIFAASRDLGNLLCQLNQKEQGLPLLEQALALGQQLGHPQTSQVEALLRQFQ